MSIAILLIYILPFFYPNLSEEPNTGFKLKGASTLMVKNDSSHPIEITLENWFLLPWKAQEIDTTILAGDSVHFQLITQSNSYFDLKIDQKKVKVFSKPNSNSSISFAGSDEELMFNGDLKTINQFIATRSEDFNSTDADWLPRVNFTQGNGSFLALITANDSITSLHCNYLLKHQDNLPKWYFEFENKRLQYLNVHWKLNSLMYRKRMMNRNVSVPENFLTNTLGSLPINDAGMLGNHRYMNFLSDYLGYNSDPLYQNEKPSTKDQWVKFYEDLIAQINIHLTGQVRETYLAFFLGNIIERRRHIFKDDWIALINDNSLRRYVKALVSSNPILPKGAKIPYFQLIDSANTVYEPRSFSGKIILINFWATWCKPCIKEFPYENKLTEKYKNEPVEIVNICIDSEFASWQKYLTKYDLKTTNLYAEGNWNNNLQENFGIQALPHSVLIDWKGHVVQNKCPAASEGVEKLIDKLLIKKKNR